MRTSRLELPLTAEEKAAIHYAAEQAYQKPAPWARAVLLAAAAEMAPRAGGKVMAAKWEKDANGHEWRKSGEGFIATIDRISGQTGRLPYYWEVYPMPRAQNLDASGRWMALASGSCQSLFAAKLFADHCLPKGGE